MSPDSYDQMKKGEALLQTLVTLTGLPEDSIRQELDRIIQKSGHTRETLTIDQLRMAMVEYLDTVHADLHLN